MIIITQGSFLKQPWSMFTFYTSCKHQENQKVFLEHWPEMVQLFSKTDKYTETLYFHKDFSNRKKLIKTNKTRTNQ